jgi:2'-5' RNA ligase
MPRLFLGLDLPASVDDHLELMSCGLPGARWEGRDKFHLTLLFIDEVDGRVHREIVDALTRLRSPRFELTLKGIGIFPPRGEPTSVWAGVADAGPVTLLKQRIEACLRGVEVEPDRRKFTPHVTLARLDGTPTDAVVAYMSAHVLFRSETFTVDRVLLFSSVRSPKGSRYRVEAGFPLQAAEG